MARPSELTEFPTPAGIGLSQDAGLLFGAEMAPLPSVVLG